MTSANGMVIAMGSVLSVHLTGQYLGSSGIFIGGFIKYIAVVLDELLRPRYDYTTWFIIYHGRPFQYILFSLFFSIDCVFSLTIDMIYYGYCETKKLLNN